MTNLYEYNSIDLSLILNGTSEDIKSGDGTTVVYNTFTGTSQGKLITNNTDSTTYNNLVIDIYKPNNLNFTVTTTNTNIVNPYDISLVRNTYYKDYGLADPNITQTLDLPIMISLYPNYTFDFIVILFGGGGGGGGGSSGKYNNDEGNTSGSGGGGGGSSNTVVTSKYRYNPNLTYYFYLGYFGKGGAGGPPASGDDSGNPGKDGNDGGTSTFTSSDSSISLTALGGLKGTGATGTGNDGSIPGKGGSKNGKDGSPGIAYDNAALGGKGGAGGYNGGYTSSGGITVGSTLASGGAGGEGGSYANISADGYPGTNGEYGGMRIIWFINKP
jgi:hypothetical protein